MFLLYKKMYLHLFNRTTEALEELERGNFAAAEEILRNAQRETEEMFIGRRAHKGSAE